MTDTDLQERPAHSPLGASSAERWMNCPGSVALIKALAITEETDEPDYRREGTAAHAMLADCLAKKLDAWEVTGEKFGADVEATAEMANAVQVFIDVARPLTVGAKVYIEYPISSPQHPDFYGTVDFAAIKVEEAVLDVLDFKYGAGIMVDVEWNPQIMYYAYGILCDFPEIRKVRLKIIQPRGFHPDGPVREWEIDAEALCTWAEETLIPAMERTAVDDTLDAGDHCRFCPAKLVCPMLTHLFRAACTANPKEIIHISDDSLGRSYKYTQAVKFYLKGMEEEVYARLNRGHEITGTKLVHKKANRVFKEGAESLFMERYGDKAMTEPKMRSPAEMEKLDGAAAKLVREWAYTPESGLTVAIESDKRPGVKVQSTTELFAASVAALENANGPHPEA